MLRQNFYLEMIKKHLDNKNSSIMVFGAGEMDKNNFNKLNFENVTFSNLNHSNNDFEILNLHDNKILDNTYDYCVAHACIHHSSQPHKAILEMYRVSKKGILIIEASDSFITRLAGKLKLSEEYEFSATNKGSTGVDNTNIPNYVFRWTEREVYKVMESYEPHIIHDIQFNYASSIKLKGLKYYFIKFFLIPYFFLFEKEKNLMSFFIKKDQKRFKKWFKN